MVRCETLAMTGRRRLKCEFMIRRVGPRPARGDRWKFNLYRLRQGPGQPGEGQAYSPPMRGDFHALDRFATLRFEE